MSFLSAAAATAEAAPATARPDARPVDLAHLARQTMGNRDLEREVLLLFVRQSEIYLDRLSAPDARVAELAHVMLGSARGIGAHQVAASAERLEQAALAGETDLAGRMSALAADVKAANAFIRSVVFTA